MTLFKSSAHSFKSSHSFQERCQESAKVLLKHTDKIPIICEKNRNCVHLNSLAKCKYLVSRTMTMGQFMHFIRVQLKLSQGEAIFLSVKNVMPTTGMNMERLYAHYKDEDGFVYITYSLENVFG